MNAYLPFVLTGLVVGSVYSIAALGLVVTYRTTGLFNFAHGAVGMAVAFAFYQLRVGWHLPTWLAFALALLIIAPVLGILIATLFRRLDGASQAAKIVVTIGLLIAIQGAVVAHYGGATRPLKPFLPTGAFRLGSTYVGVDQVIVMLVGLAVLGVLLAFFRWTRLGVAMRGIVDNRDLLEISAFSVSRIEYLTWVLGAVLAGLAGILFSPFLGLDSIALTLLVVQSYTAAVFGRLTDLRRTAIAALVLGVANTLTLKLLGHYPVVLNGLRPSLPFLFLFGVLLLMRPGRLPALGATSPWAGLGTSRAPRLSTVVAAFGLVGLGSQLLSHSNVLLLGLTLVYGCAFLSITVLTSASGMICLAQAGFVACGAFAFSHLSYDLHLPFVLGVVGAGLVVVPLGVILAVPALRLPSLFLALATFGMGQLLDGLVFGSWHWLSGGEIGVSAPRPDLLAGDRAYVWFVLLVVAGFVLAIGLLRQSALGRSLVALRDSSPASEAIGINPLWPKLAIFAVSAFMAGVAGALYASLLQVANKNAFTTFTSLLWIAIVVVGGIQSVWGALAGAALYYFVPGVLVTRPSPWLIPLFGIGTIINARRPGGLAALASDYLPTRLLAVRRPPRPSARAAPVLAGEAAPHD